MKINDIEKCLPEKIVSALKSLKNTEHLAEIRLRCGAYQTFTVKNENYIISSDGKAAKNVYNPLCLTEQDISDTLCRLCGGALYSHSNELSKGFVTVDGVRVGVGGYGIINGGNISGFSRYCFLNIRIPRHIKGAAACLMNVIEKHGSDFVGGVLVVSPPGMGKTTFLRSFAASLSKGYRDKGVMAAKRVAIADERGELYIPQVFENSLCDAILYLPKPAAVEMLTRSMSPQYIFCDEIGQGEAECIAKAATGGVTFAASCHGVGLEDIITKPDMKKLFDVGVFSTLCCIYTENIRRRCKIIHIADGKVVAEGDVPEC